MTQTPRPQEGKDKENFSQVANVLIQGYPELDLQSRYVPIALTSICWEEKYYPLSLRQIASLAHVDHTALRSRNGAKPREGILDRLKRVGILDYKDEKPVDPTTGKEGRSQTYICIKYSNIWKENARFFADKKTIKVTPLTVDPVNNDNNVEVTTVDQNNHTVDQNNHTVDPVNHTVDNACSDAGHNTVIPEDSNTFTPARESENDQIGQPPSEEKKSDVIAQTKTPATLSYSQNPQKDVLRPGSWLQEKSETPVNAAPSQEKAVQTNIFGEALPEKSAVPATPRPRIPVSVKPDVPEIRQKTAAEIQKERKAIERNIWKLLDDAANAKIGRAFTKPMEDLVTGVMDGAYVDADFTFSVQDLKARRQSLTFSNIVNNMADAVTKRKAGEQPGKIIPFQPGQQQHKGSPNAPLLDERVIQERSARNLEERKARIAAREAQKAAMA